MFGLENQKKKKDFEEFIFDLEKELKNPSKNKTIKDWIEGRIQRVKDILRSGESQAEFDHFGVLLHGYTSLIKVLGRFSNQKK